MQQALQGLIGFSKLFPPVSYIPCDTEITMLSVQKTCPPIIQVDNNFKEKFFLYT